MADTVLSLVTDKMKARFWRHVEKRGPDECWEWTASKNRGGYGQFMVRAGLVRRAHQMALYLTGSPRPDDLHALHHCDNRLCCNPAHLRWGTVAENANDKIERGRDRTPRGERAASNKLTEQQVREIRASDETHRALAAHYGVSKTVVTAIKSLRKWRWLT